MKRKNSNPPPPTHDINHKELAREIVKAQAEAEAEADHINHKELAREIVKAQAEAEADEDDRQRQAGCGNLFAFIILCVIVAAILPSTLDMLAANTDQQSPSKATAAAHLARATATAETCIDRQHQNWCHRRRAWDTNAEAQLSLLLKSKGGRDALTTREQEQISKIENELSHYRLICEGSAADDIFSALQDSFNLDRQIAEFKSNC